MEPMRFNARFDDIRQLGEAAGWDLEFRQLSYGRQAIAGEFIVGEHVTILDVSFNCAFHQLGIAPPETVTVGIPYAGVRRWFNGDCGPLNILPFNQASGFDCVSDETFCGWTLSINERYLQAVAERCVLPFDDRLWRPDSETLIAASAETQALCDLIWVCTKRLSSTLSPEIEERIAIGLLAASRHQARAEKSRPATRTRALSAAMEYLHYHEHEPVKIQEICASTGVAVRTLERAIQRALRNRAQGVPAPRAPERGSRGTVGARR